TTLDPGAEFSIGEFTFRVLRGEPGLQEVEPPAPAPAPRKPDELVTGLVGLTALVGVTDQQAVLETLLDRVKTLLDAPRGFILLIQGKNMVPVLTSTAEASGPTHTFSRTICQRAVDGRAPVWLSRGRQTSEIDEIASIVLEKASTVVALPLIDSGEVLGVL